MIEIWKDVKGYEGLYQVSNLGRIKSLSRVDDRGHKIKERILKSYDNGKGYLLVRLCKNGKREPFLVHRLVAIAFIPNPNNLPEVNHIIDDFEHRSDNRVENLEWCTRDYNCNYGSRNEKISKSIKDKYTGDKNPRAKKVECITTGEMFTTIKEAEEKYNVDHSNISKCCRGERNYAGKHPITGEKLVWEYID